MMTDKIMNDAIAAFGGAVTPIAPAQPEKKGSRPERERVELGEDLDHLAALSLVSKALADVAKVIGTEQKQKMLMEFAKRMFQYKTRPESFVGFGPRSEGYVQLSRKGSNAPLDELTVKRIDELKVPYDKHETVPARLVINPEVLADQKLLKALADAVKNAPGLQG
ncbi:MAG: hypothetical protein HY735_37745, partial [Verrucomicrobia bacterium]|nr:hypothetical protein [Verrucomicrobiota bacterium]